MYAKSITVLHALWIGFYHLILHISWMSVNEFVVQVDHSRVANIKDRKIQLFFLILIIQICKFSLVAQLCLILWPHGLQHARPPCPSPTPSLLKLMSIELVMPSNHLILCHPLFSHLQSFPASGSFPRSQFFASGGQSIGVSASASVLPMNVHDWFPLG